MLLNYLTSLRNKICGRTRYETLLGAAIKQMIMLRWLDTNVGDPNKSRTKCNGMNACNEPKALKINLTRIKIHD